MFPFLLTGTAVTLSDGSQLQDDIGSAKGSLELSAKVFCKYDQRRTSVVGGGITERNLRRILDETGASEFHASARAPRDTTMTYVNPAVSMSASHVSSDLQMLKVTDRDRVRSLISIAREAI